MKKNLVCNQIKTSHFYLFNHLFIIPYAQKTYPKPYYILDLCSSKKVCNSFYYLSISFGKILDLNLVLYRTRAIKGRRHYSKIMFWGLRLLHKTT